MDRVFFLLKKRRSATYITYREYEVSKIFVFLCGWSGARERNNFQIERTLQLNTAHKIDQSHRAYYKLYINQRVFSMSVESEEKEQNTSATDEEKSVQEDINNNTALEENGDTRERDDETGRYKLGKEVFKARQNTQKHQFKRNLHSRKN